MCLLVRKVINIYCCKIPLNLLAITMCVVTTNLLSNVVNYIYSSVLNQLSESKDMTCHITQFPIIDFYSNFHTLMLGSCDDHYRICYITAYNYLIIAYIFHENKCSSTDGLLINYSDIYLMDK